MKEARKSSSVNLPADLFALEEVVGEFMHYWGFKKIHGRIWLHLYGSQEPLDTAELMGRLKVSKGLMSLAIRDLLDYKVIKPSATGRHGVVFFEANKDIRGVITNVLKERELKMLALAEKYSRKLCEMDSAKLGKAGLSQEQIQSILDMTESAQMLLKAFLVFEPALQEEGLFDNLLPNEE